MATWQKWRLCFNSPLSEIDQRKTSGLPYLLPTKHLLSCRGGANFPLWRFLNWVESNPEESEPRDMKFPLFLSFAAAVLLTSAHPAVAAELSVDKVAAGESG